MPNDSSSGCATETSIRRDAPLLLINSPCLPCDVSVRGADGLPRQQLSQKLTGVAVLDLRDLLRRALRDNHAAGIAPLGAQVDDVIGNLNDIRVVLDDQHRVPLIDQR